MGVNTTINKEMVLNGCRRVIRANIRFWYFYILMRTFDKVIHLVLLAYL
jgi:hypothetical protein